eukprot:gene27376-biopygen10456
MNSCHEKGVRELESKLLIPRKAFFPILPQCRSREKLIASFDSSSIPVTGTLLGRIPHIKAVATSQTGHCYRGIDVCPTAYRSAVCMTLSNR